MSNREKLYYPFAYTHHYAYVVAFYGSNAPTIVKGPLIMKTYYKDDSKKEVDIQHTSEYFMDELFYGIHYLNEAEARKICSYYTNE